MKKFVSAITFVILLAANASAMELQTGVWNINGNGFTGNLNITAIDAEGNITGDVFGNAIQGFWDRTSQRIMFIRTPDADSSYNQVYTGYLFYTPTTGKYTLAGYFEAFTGTGATSSRNVFGWYAEVIRAPD